MNQVDLQAVSERELKNLLRTARTREQSRAAHAVLERLRNHRLALLTADFAAATRHFAGLSDELQALVLAHDRPDSRAGLAVAHNLLDLASQSFAAIRDPERFSRAIRESEIGIAVQLDEKVVPAAAPGPPLVVAAPPPEITVSALPPPVNSRDFPALKDEYARMFDVAEVRPAHIGALAFYTNRIKRHRPRYEAVADAAGGRIPWYVIGCIHALESSFDFNTHLFNGDPLSARTVRVPKGQPEADPEDGVRYTWEESALASMRRERFEQASDWSLPRILYRLETYNGFGYRPQRVPTPYLWSFSTVYDRGRFVRDHVFDRTAESKQAGAATILKQLARDREITLSA